MTAMTAVERDISLSARHLDVWYGSFQAIRDVSLDVEARAVTALIGPSGCGKSTLLRCFNRLHDRHGDARITGDIRVLGTNIHDPAVDVRALRRAVGMVFQRPNPLPLSVADNVLFGLRAAGGDRHQSRAVLGERVECALRQVQLWEQVKDRLGSVATGLTLEQQQKLCIARLLPLEPEVILMDEPCSALDGEGTEAIETLILSLKQRCTILIVTHNMAQARRVSDSCVFMMLGRMVEHAPTVDLFLHPRQPETEAYVEGRYG